MRVFCRSKVGTETLRVGVAYDGMQVKPCVISSYTCLIMWITFVTSSLYFWKSVFSFQADSILKSDGDFISNWKFPDCVHFFGAWTRQAVIETIAVVYQLTKRTLWRRNCSPMGHNNRKHFLCPIRSRHLLEFLETVRWESVPRGSFVRTWKLSSCLFSRPDWLPLGLRGWKWLRWRKDRKSRRDRLQ